MIENIGLLKEATKKWNGTSSTYSVLAITIADQNASKSKYCLSLHCNCGNFSHLWNECLTCFIIEDRYNQQLSKQLGEGYVMLPVILLQFATSIW